MRITPRVIAHRATATLARRCDALSLSPVRRAGAPSRAGFIAPRITRAATRNAHNGALSPRMAASVNGKIVARLWFCARVRAHQRTAPDAPFFFFFFFFFLLNGIICRRRKTRLAENNGVDKTVFRRWRYRVAWRRVSGLTRRIAVVAGSDWVEGGLASWLSKAAPAPGRFFCTLPCFGVVACDKTCGSRVVLSSVYR